MGMPAINIIYQERAITAIERSERGIVGLILHDAVPEESAVCYSISSITDIPEWISKKNKKQIELAMMGYVKAPKKVIAYIIKEGEEYTDALKHFSKVRIDYLAIPTVSTDNKAQDVVTWIKQQRQNGKKRKAVLPNISADTEGVINFATKEVYEGDVTYATEEYCSRIAGIIAGTPISISCTYAPLMELTGCTEPEDEEKDAEIDHGKLFLFFDEEKVKVARGVNSLVTTTSEKGEQFKKIKIVEAMDMIFDDITKTAQDHYLGKYPNSYDNKCLLISAIRAYFEKIKKTPVISSYSIDIDVEANKNYLLSIGTDVEVMSEDEIKKADTGSRVFLCASLKILDAIEDIELPIAI